jgi:restriction system protein
MLIKDTLKRIKEMSWPDFEIEISRFLLHLGYGKGVVNAVKVTQRSRDGGIDGYIKCDDLGVERIFFQAKKWDETLVSDKTIREFVGAMVVQSGVKFGVLVTTSKFTKDARKYAEQIQNPRVIIIDGKELAELYLKRSNQPL